MLNKEEVISQLEERLSKCTIAIVTSYQGLSVAEMNQLRRKLRESTVEYRVVRNTLARFAAERAGKKDLQELLQGSSAIAFGYGEVTEVAKVLADYMQSSRTPLAIKGGMMSTRFLTPEEVKLLSSLPSREVLISRVMQGMQRPLLSFLSVPMSIMRNLVGTLEARRQQLADLPH